MILNNSAEDSSCPKCKGDLELEGGSDMETEKWYCMIVMLFEVQVEMVRFWDTLEEVL